MLNIYLPGYSEKNLDFSLKLGKKLTKKGINIYSRTWRHWLSGELAGRIAESLADEKEPPHNKLEPNASSNDRANAVVDSETILKFETAETAKVVHGFRKNFGIIAKSFGNMVALKLFEEQGYTPKYLISMGLPTSYSTPDTFKSIGMTIEKLIESGTNVEFWVNENDPVASKDAIENMAAELGLPPENTRTFPASGHGYEYYLEILEFIQGFEARA